MHDADRFKVHFLRQRLGWSVQKLLRRTRERDEAPNLYWQSHKFPRIAHAAQAPAVGERRSNWGHSVTTNRAWRSQNYQR